MNRQLWYKCLIIIVLTGLVKAYIHMIRILILAAIGLAGMYMLHALAQDYNKIRHPVKAAVKLLGIGKRSVPQEGAVLEVKNFGEGLQKVLKNDPLGCARKFVCFIASKNSRNLTERQKRILSMIRSMLKSFHLKGWQRALDIAKIEKMKSGICEKVFSDCQYGTAQLEGFMANF